MTKDYHNVLEDENKIISKVLDKQNELRNSIKEKNWELLMDNVTSINELMDQFNKLDKKREEISIIEANDDAETYELLAKVRGKLVKCRIENKALSDYINISRNFVKEIIDTALPQSRNKLYSRNGFVVQPQPACVVVNTLF